MSRRFNGRKATGGRSKMNRGLWRTAALAAAIIFVGNVFVTRLQEWSKGLNSEFVAYGQGTGTTGSGGGGGGGTGTSGVTVTKVIPHIVAGGGYRTFIQIINQGSSAVNVSANFFKPLDGTPSVS